jgi:tetrahydromethanopterin S-methyltransferase subunit F
MAHPATALPPHNDGNIEHFPRSSLLYIFGWIGHMIIGAASATETMLELGREISQPLPVVQLADTAYQFTLELEEMYDLDTAWLMYTRFFRSIRKVLGIDEQYEGVRERVELLARNAEVNERIRTERETVEVTIIGAILAIVLIALAALTVPVMGTSWAFRVSFIGGSVLLVLIIMIYRFVRSKRRWARRLR